MPPGTVSSRVRLIMDAQKVEEGEVEQSGVPVERQASVPRLQVRQALARVVVLAVCLWQDACAVVLQWWRS